MTITYPLSLPTVTGFNDITLRATNAVAYDQSPFTFSGQSQAYAGQAWSADLSLPPMKRERARVWTSWLTSLRGQFGTFLLGDPQASTPSGGGGGSPVVDGAAQTGGQLDITGATASITSWLKAGDYIQLGAAGTATLHKVLQDVDTNSSGEATLEIWPYLRSSPTTGSTVVINNPQGRFRLAANEVSWNISDAELYGISFAAMEAI